LKYKAVAQSRLSDQTLSVAQIRGLLEIIIRRNSKYIRGIVYGQHPAVKAEIPFRLQVPEESGKDDKSQVGLAEQRGNMSCDDAAFRGADHGNVASRNPRPAWINWSTQLATFFP